MYYLLFILHSSDTRSFFCKELDNLDAVEGDTVVLNCELSQPNITVEWRKGGIVLQPSKKYEFKQMGYVQELHISDLKPEDSGYYTCDAGDQLTTASVSVQGKGYYISAIYSHEVYILCICLVVLKFSIFENSQVLRQCVVRYNNVLFTIMYYNVTTTILIFIFL